MATKKSTPSTETATPAEQMFSLKEVRDMFASIPRLESLKADRKKLDDEITTIEASLKTLGYGKIAKATTASTKGGKRVDGEVLKTTILKIVVAAGSAGISQADIVKHGDMVALYKTVGKDKVPPQAQMLAKMVEDGGLKKKGEGKASRYHA